MESLSLTDTIISSSAPSDKQETSWLAELRNLAGLLFIVLCIHSFIAKPFYIPSASMMPGLLKGDRLVVSKYPYGWSFASVSFHLAPRFSGRLFGRLPARGDVAIVEPNGMRTDYIKRVIGLPGDTVEVRQGRLWLNGAPVRSEVMPSRSIPIDLNIDDPNEGNDGCTGSETVSPDGQRLCTINIVRETMPDGTFYDTIDNGYRECFRGEPCADDFAAITVPAGHVFLMGDNRDNSSDGRFPAGDPYKGLGGPVPLENLGGRAEFITFSLDGSASWYNPISWFTSMRGGRAGTSLRPGHTTPPARVTSEPAAAR